MPGTLRFERTVRCAVRLWPCAKHRTPAITGWVRLAAPSRLTDDVLIEEFQKAAVRLRESCRDGLPEFDDFALQLASVPHGPDSEEWNVTVIDAPVCAATEYCPPTGLITVSLCPEGERS